MLFRVLSVFFALTYLSACSTTSITDAWQEPEFKKSSMKDVLVVGMASNPTNRLLFETGFVAALTEHGIKATASYTAIGDAYPTQEAVEKYLASHPHDYIIVTSLGAVDVETDYVPESVRSYYTGPYYPYWGSYWGAGNTVTMTREAYTDTQTNVTLTTSIFDFEDQQKKLVWAGRSKTFEVTSISYTAGELASNMVRKIKN